MLTRIWTTTLLLVLTAGIHGADALTSERCLATKLKTAGKLVACDAGENAKALQGRPFDSVKCRTTFDTKVAKLDARAFSANIPCRHYPTEAGTVTDPATGLEWETKSGTLGGAPDYNDPHNVNNSYNWCIGEFEHDGCTNGVGVPDGRMFTDFLAKLNNCTSSDGVNVINAGFAGHCDWRIPTMEELKTILLVTPSCGLSSACIDPMFGPTRPGVYWSLTTLDADADYVWGVDFSGTYPNFADYKFPAESVRAVRGGLTASPGPGPPSP